jgi:eukaryotic-like serine/threonine-protein kinase
MKPGDQLTNRYRIEGLLAEGGFGTTYLAIDLQYPENRKVVVKHLRTLDKLPGTLEAAKLLFESEAKALADLGEKSERIPTLHAYFFEQNEFYLVLEFIEGQTLTAELSDRKLTELEICSVLKEILLGLQEVHVAHKIHRDLKPDNIIRRSEDKRLVLIDFGSVKDVCQVSSLETNSPATRNVGTTGFSPTEQLNGYPVFASDIYAVGAIGAQCIMGKQPYALFDRDMQELRWYNANHPNLGKILRKMLRNQHLERYQNAKEALDAIEKLITSLMPPVESGMNHENFESSPVLPESNPPSPIKSRNLKRRPFIYGSCSLLSILGLSTLFGFLTKKQTFSKITVRSVILDQFGKVSDHPTSSVTIFTEDLGKGISMVMVKIPAGSFNMGSPDNEKNRDKNESPQHLLTLPAFYLGQTLVTQEQWETIMGTNPSFFKGNNKLPVDSVTWLEAMDFCQRLTRKTGRTYRLPSEAEWEYACRAGTTTPFAFGETITPEIANFDGTRPYASASEGENRKRTTPVATFQPNAFGLYDMHGNIWEWCLDEWVDNYNNGSMNSRARGDLKSQNPKKERLLRGGSWNYGAKSSRSADRSHVPASRRKNWFGLRVVAD